MIRNSFFTKIRKRQGHLSAFLFNIVLEVLLKAVRKGNRSHRDSEEKRKLLLFVDDMVAYVENPKE